MTLDQLRTVVKRNGFTPKEAVVTAVGRPVQRNGTLAFEVSGLSVYLVIAPGRSAAPALKQLTGAAADAAPASSVIVGTVDLRSDGTEEVAVTSSTPKR